MAVFSLGNSAPFIGTLSAARGAAFEVFKIIDRVSLVWLEQRYMLNIFY